MSTIEHAPVREVPLVLDPRVERGAALLDKRMPGWAERIDLEMFVLADCKRCVLGQLGGHYWGGLDELKLSSRDGAEHGFDVYAPETHDALEQDWRLAILSRRSA